MGMLARLRYILEVMKIPSAVDAIMQILCCIGTHSKWAATKVLRHPSRWPPLHCSSTQIMECPRLFTTVQSLFITPEVESQSKANQEEQYPYGGFPTSCAIRLLRILTQSSSVLARKFSKEGLFNATKKHLLKPGAHLPKLLLDDHPEIVTEVRLDT